MKKGRTRCPTSTFILLLRARLELAGHNEEPVFITLEAISRRGLGEALHLGSRVFLAVLGVLHHVGESHQRLVGGCPSRSKRHPPPACGAPHGVGREHQM